MEPHQHHHNQHQHQQSTRYSSLPAASHCGGMFPVWSIESSGRQCLDMACTIWKVILCTRQIEDVKKQNALCQRICICTWILGLAFGTVATILSFTEGDNNKASQLCLWVSVVGSCLTGLGHFYVLTKKSFCSRKMWILARFVMSIVGVFLVLCLTATGASISKNVSVLFEMCGVASVVCYISVGIALSKRLFWEYQRDFADVRSRRVGRRNARRTANRPIRNNNNAENNNMFIIYNECGGQIEIVRGPRRGSPSNNNSRNFIVSNNYSGYSHNHNTSSANIWNMSCISLPVLSIPSYEDTVADSERAASFKPPKYTEYDVTAVSATETELATNPDSENVASSDENPSRDQQQVSDPPPRYTEHTSDVIPADATETHNIENENV